MVPLGKHFLHGHVDLTSVPRTRVKMLSVNKHPSGPSSEVTETRRLSGICQPDSLAQQVSSR